MADTIAELASLLKLGPDAPLQPPRFAKVVSVAGDAVTVTLGGSNADAVRCCACSADDVVLLETMPSGQLAAVATKGASGSSDTGVVHYMPAIVGGTGYLRLCIIHTGSNTNHGDAPIRISYAHRNYGNAYVPDYAEMVINFSSNADPSMIVFRADGLHAQDARIVKDAEYTWSLWVKKWGNWDTITVYRCIVPNPPITTVEIEWCAATSANYSANAPTGITQWSCYTSGAACWYGTSSTGDSTAAKVVSSTGFLLTKGAIVSVLFSTANTVSGAITLNVGSTGAKTVQYHGAVTSAANPLTWSANTQLTFTYTGTYWALVAMV